MWSIIELAFLSSSLIFMSVFSEVIPPSIEIKPSCKYKGININFSGAEVAAIRRNWLSSLSLNSLVNCINLQNNPIISIDSLAFANFQNLYYLNLMGSWLSRETFPFNSIALKTLVLDDAFANKFKREEWRRLSYHRHSGHNSEFPQIGPGEFNLEITSRFPNLTTLYLRNNYLAGLSWPRGAPNITHLYLDENVIKLACLPSSIPRSLTHLSLKKNSIKQWNDSMILGQLEDFILDQNHIKRLCHAHSCYEIVKTAPQCYCQGKVEVDVESQFMNLQNATKLKQLSLASNGLMIIPPNSMTHLQKLEFLDLSDNLLGEIPPEIFNLSNLITLIMSKNPLRTIPKNVKLWNVSKIFMKAANITDIPIDTFDGWDTPQLQVLSLADNGIDQIEDKTFTALSSLRELDLSRNKLCKLPGNWVGPITHLHLDKNHFNNIEDTSVIKIKTLVYLNLAGNPFEELSIHSLLSLPKNATVNVKSLSRANTRP